MYLRFLPMVAYENVDVITICTFLYQHSCVYTNFHVQYSNITLINTRSYFAPVVFVNVL